MTRCPLSDACRTVSAGDAAKTFTITFQQGEGSNPLLHMMMQGMASQASPSVKESLQQKL
ncbi:FHA domain-containing protein [Haematococcus lacustris]|uniref:FHA domain-containing protein n=1 Tax=Haematococcus lacustris TaxID=44745 RepID=A0A6A0A6H0_HAELA|nr:FHA domain-containing protein [Haematococcus lacustris]